VTLSLRWTSRSWRLDQLEKYAERMPPQHLAWLKRDFDLESLLSHPRYQALIASAEAQHS